MPLATQPVPVEGPIVEVLVGVTPSQRQRLLSSGQPVPSPVRSRALIDTGSSQSCIDTQLISALGLEVAGQKQFFSPTPTGVGQTFDIYDASLTLLHPETNLFLPSVEVVGA